MSGAGVDPRSSNIYIGGHDGYCYCLDATTGDKLWQYPTGGTIISCPVIVGDLVLVGSYDRRLYALDRTAGSVQWSFEANGWITSSPSVTDGHVAFADRADIQNPDRTPGNRTGSLHVLKGVQ